MDGAEIKRRLLSTFRLSKRAYYADFLITPPLTTVLLVLSVLHGFSPLWPAQFAIGVIAWTLYEYIAHRWLLHQIWFFSDLHDLHHADPKDYIGIHPAVTLTLYAGFWFVFGSNYSALAVGFSVGYVAYSCLHTAFHYARIVDGNLLFNLKRRHALHHTFYDNNYGVSTSAWDRLLGTEK
jgi:sterol desaturase/sphingolipid hydroxylase (fatty acid hydroxylase superfamily)